VEAPTRKPVKVKGAKPLPVRRRTLQEIEIDTEAWVSYDGKLALPVCVLAKDDRNYLIEFEYTSRRAARLRGDRVYVYRDELRTTPEAACVNRVTG
jgi:hypothetical protein